MSKKRIRFPTSIIMDEIKKPRKRKKLPWEFCGACGRAWVDHPGIMATCESLAHLRLAAVNCREAQLNDEQHPSTKARAARLCAEAHLDVLLEELRR